MEHTQHVALSLGQFDAGAVSTRETGLTDFHLLAFETWCNATYEDSATVHNAVVYQKLDVDFPAEEDSSTVSQSVLAWLCDEVRGRCFPNYEGTPIDSAICVEADAETFAEDMVKTYGRLGLERMVSELREIAEEGFSNSYNNYLTIELLEDTVSYLTMSLGHEVYTGGAHGLFYTEGVTFRKSDGQQLGWQHFNMDKRAELVELMKQELMSYFSGDGDNAVTTDSALFDHLLLYDNPDTPQNELEFGLPLPATQPWITRDGINFLYQQYEIAAYAYGCPWVTLPIDAVKPFLTTDGLQFIGAEQGANED